MRQKRMMYFVKGGGAQGHASTQEPVIVDKSGK